MRYASAILPLSALMTAACSTGPADEDRQAASTHMQNCAGDAVKKSAPILTDILAKLDAASAEKPAKQAKPDFTITGKLPAYEEAKKDGDESIKAKYDVGVTFKSAGGTLSASLSGSKLTTDKDGQTRNYPLFHQDLDVTSTDFRGVDIAASLKAGEQCAIAAQDKLGLKM